MEPYFYKQILVVRKDLKMRMGKVAAQAAHASLKATLDNMDDARVKAWLSGPFAKICVYVESEEELLEVERNAQQAGLITAMIVDAGRTEFHGVPTRTVLAVGPATHEELQPVTGSLKLL